MVFSGDPICELFYQNRIYFVSFVDENIPYIHQKNAENTSYT
jgi:hypothetical protein